jgi:hypothetical protein
MITVSMHNKVTSMVLGRLAGRESAIAALCMRFVVLTCWLNHLLFLKSTVSLRLGSVGSSHVVLRPACRW